MKTFVLLFALLGALHCQASVTFVGNVNAPFNALTYPPRSYDLDFDGDSVAELRFTALAYEEVHLEYLSANVETQAVPIPPQYSVSDSVPLSAGMVVDAAPASFGQWETNSIGSSFLQVLNLGTYGYWQDTNNPNALVFNGYLGVRFQKPDGWHYGWVNLDISIIGTGVVRSYAWETAPNTAIVAAIPSTPEPGRVALLLLGAVMCVMRRRGRLQLVKD